MVSDEQNEKKDNVIWDFVSGNQVKATPEEIEAVQPFSKRLVQDFHYTKEQIITHPQFRIRKSPSDESKSYPVDIAVFKNNRKTEDNLLMIVECKQKKREDGIEQLKIYLNLSQASIGVWFNGSEHCYLQKFVTPQGFNSYREIPNIPFNGQRIEDIGKYYRKDLKPTLNLRTVFKDIRNHIAGNTTGVTRDETIASEIINLLFCKIYDEINTAPKEVLQFRCGINEPAKEVAERILHIFENVKKDYADVFQKNDGINLDAKTISYIIGELQPYCITEAERDIIGEAFEVFIGPALKGSQGQFFTPRNIVKTAIEIINPGMEDKIVDPACGSGGFLIVALEYVWSKINAEAVARGMGKHWVRNKEDQVAQNNFRGIDKDFFLSKITKAYMAIVGDGRGGIFCENSLLQSQQWESRAKDEVKNEMFDIVLTNPPFGAKITINDREILKNYALGYKWKKDKKTGKWEKTEKILKQQAPQVLFIERCYSLLKPGGKLGIILPDGVLGGSKIGYIPYFIKDKFELVASIDCPLESFSPNTTTKVHLLVLRKKIKAHVIKKIFMGVPAVIGHDKKGHPVYEDIRNEIIRDDLNKTISGWKKFSEGKESQSVQGFSILYDELEDTLNAKRYLPDFMEVLRYVENSKLQKLKIRDIYEKLCTGANVDNLDYVDDETEGKPYILVKNILDEGITFSNMKFIRKSLADTIKNARVKEGDIIINRCGDAGISAIVTKDLEGAIACGFCFILRVKKDYDPYYVAAFLNSRLGRKQLKRLAIGSILVHITKEDLQGVQILFPDKKALTDEISGKFKAAADYRLRARASIGDMINLFEKGLMKR